MDAIAHTQVSGLCLVTLVVLLRAQQKMRDKSLPGRQFTALLWFAGALTIIDYGSALAQLGAWEDLGIPLTISKMEWSSFTPARRAGEYDVARNGWVMDYNDPSNMIELFTTTNGNNDGKYSNPEFDAAVEASKVADKSVHFQKLHEAEDILMEDAACIPVAYYNDFWLQSPSLKGTWHSPYGYWYLQYGYVEE